MGWIDDERGAEERSASRWPDLRMIMPRLGPWHEGREVWQPADVHAHLSNDGALRASDGQRMDEVPLGIASSARMESSVLGMKTLAS